MPKVVIKGQEELNVPTGTNLLKLIQEKGYDAKLPASCGGMGACSTCAVRVFKGGGPPNTNEQDILGEDQLKDHWRLSCQINVTEDLEIEVPGFEVVEALKIEPALLRNILNYSAERLPLRQIPSTQAITVSRIKDLNNRVEALVDGGGDAKDFEILRDLLSYSLKTGRVAELTASYGVTEEQIKEILDAFSARIPPEEEEILTYPYFLYVITTIAFFLTAALGIYSIFVDAPIEEPATPAFTPNPEKAPWYFLFIQELLAISPNLGGFLTSVAIGGVIIPGLIVFVLLAIPYIEPYLEFWRKDKTQPPGRRIKERPVTVMLFTSLILLMLMLGVIGIWFRGPNWEFVLPWR